MKTQTITKFHIGNREIPVECYVMSETDITFRCYVGDEEAKASSLDALRTKAMRALKAQKGTFHLIPVSDISYADQIKNGVITGIHSGTGNVLVRWDGEKRAQQEPSYRGNLFRRLSEDQQKAFQEQVATINRERKALDKIRETFKTISMDQIVAEGYRDEKKTA